MPSESMPSIFKKLTPNLLVANVERSLAFYEGVLGFARGFTVPEQSPFVFASVTGGAVEIFFNDAGGAIKEYPAFGGKPIGATGTMYIEVEGVDALHDRLKATVPIVMPLVTQFYGMREFAIEDPDGYVITFAERVP
jgi:lactoylglutathione lyase